MIIIKNFNDNQENKSKFNGNEFKSNIKKDDSKEKMLNYEETSMLDSTKDLRHQEKQQIQKYDQNKLNFNNKSEQDKSNNNKNDEQNRLNNEDFNRSNVGNNDKNKLNNKNDQNSFSNKNDQNFNNANNINKNKDKDKNKDRNNNNNNIK